MALKKNDRIMPEAGWKNDRAFIALCGFFMLALVFCGFSSAPACAQITPTSRIELSDNLPTIPIGQHIYITPDPERKLTYQVITSRHQNNLRGQRQDKGLINLGLAAPPVWMVFSVTNNSSEEEWILHFGALAQGRTALAHKILVRNDTSRAEYARALREPGKAGAFGDAMHGPALPIRISKGQTAMIVIYMEVEGGLPNTIVPTLITRSAYFDSLRYGDFLSNLAAVFFLTVIGFFLAIVYLKKNPEYLLFVGYYAASGLLMLVLSTLFFARVGFTGELLFILYAAISLFALATTKTFLNITVEDHTGNTALFSSGAIIVFSTLFNIVLFGEDSVLDDLLIFLPVSLGFAVAAALSFLQGYSGKYNAYFFASGWFVIFIGNLLTAFAAADIISSNAFTMNIYWLSFLPQAAFFALAVSKKLEMTEQEERYLKSRESRAAQSLARLQQSKESADQARLLRVIERERELMAELREREMQRAEEMRLAKEMADEANRSKSAFLAVVSHEIRTPMTGILGMVRLLNDTKLSKEQNDYAQAIQNSGDSMMALLNDILDFEKIESGNMELEKIDFDMLKLVQGVITLMSGHAEEKGISLKSDISEGFPRYLVGDPTRLRQIFLNLVNNAIKFTNEGGVTIQLRATKLDEKQRETLKSDYEVYFAIKDTGIGIPESQLENLFSPFSQAEKSTARKYGGTGLGLAICKRLTEAMGSALSVESHEGKGSTFFFSALMQEGREEASEENAKTGNRRSNVPAMNILVVEDNEMNRKVLQGFLLKDGHNVSLADSGETALEIIEDGNFDVMLTDISLSGMDGMETAKTIRTLPDRTKASIPIIAISGNVGVSDVQNYYDAGINGFIAKPIDPEELMGMLGRVHRGNLAHPVVLPNRPKPPVEESHKAITEAVAPPRTSEPPDKTAKNPIQKYLDMHPKSHEFDDYNSFEEASSLPASAEAEHPSGSILDLAMLGALIESLGKDQFSNLIDGYQTTANNLVGTLLELRQSQNIAHITERAHELKGMAANFGFTEVSDIAKTIEKAGQNGDISAALPGIEKLPGANRRAEEAISKWLGQQG